MGLIGPMKWLTLLVMHMEAWLSNPQGKDLESKLKLFLLYPINYDS